MGKKITIRGFDIFPYCWKHWLEFFPSLQRLAEPYSGRMQGPTVKYGRIRDMNEERALARRWEELAQRWSRPEHADDVSPATLPPGDEDHGAISTSISVKDGC